MKKLFVFDLDDTLIDNVHDYAPPILDMARLIIEVLGSRAPHVSKIISLEEDIDSSRVREINPVTGRPFGYSMERFPGTMVETYRTICRQANVVSEPDVENQLYAIGMRAFDKSLYEKNIKPGASEVIDFIYNQGDDCMLLTKGDERVQNNKINALSRANIYFSAGIKIVDDKLSSLFKEIAERFKGYKLYSVGNDYNKDIAPALNGGAFYGIWIPVETWEVIGKMDEIRSKVDRTRCLEIRSIIELKERYGDVIWSR